MAKSPDAFRTISEVADWLGIQAHVLRFWESKFSQVKPVKRAGGRRYYRPNDMLLLGGIRKLLHEDGLTIKGVQKILREEGVNHVIGMSPALDELTQSQIEDAPVAPTPAPEPIETPKEKGVVLNFEEPAQATPQPEAPPPPKPAPPVEEPSVTLAKSPAPEPAPPPNPPVQETAPPTRAEPETAVAPAAPQEAAELPAFLRRPMADKPQSEDAAPAKPPPAAPPVEVAPPPPKPRVINLPPLPKPEQIPAEPGALTAALRARALSAEQARAIAPLAARLSALRDAMAARRRPGGNTGPTN